LFITGCDLTPSTGGRVKREIQKVVEAIVNGVKGSELKDRMADLQNRKDALLKQLEAADEPPPLLHQSMADLYRSKVEELATAGMARLSPPLE
jgi:hypothetical protein